MMSARLRIMPRWRIETRIDNAVNDLRHRMNDENAALLAQFDAKDLRRSERGLHELIGSATSSIKRSMRSALTC